MCDSPVQGHASSAPHIHFVRERRRANGLPGSIEQSAFRVVGIPSANGKWDLEDAGAKAAEYWEELGTDVHKVVNLMDGSEPAGLLGVQFCKDGDFDCYMACVATNQPCPNEMEERVVAAATYAVFECEGAMPDAMNDLWHRILTEWLPSSGYEWEKQDGCGALPHAEHDLS